MEKAAFSNSCKHRVDFVSWVGSCFADDCKMTKLALNRKGKSKFSDDKCIICFQAEFQIASVKCKVITLALLYLCILQQSVFKCKALIDGIGSLKAAFLDMALHTVRILSAELQRASKRLLQQHCLHSRQLWLFFLEAKQIV